MTDRRAPPASADDGRYREQIERLFARSPFYARKLRDAGFASAAAVSGLDRIAALPFTTKDELRQSQLEHPPLGAHAAIVPSEAARIYSTSGTSGVPCYIPLTRRDLADWRAIAARSYARSGLSRGDRVVTTYNAGPFVAAAALDAFDDLGVTHIPVGTGNTEKLVTALRMLAPQALVCTPSYAVYIAEWALAKGWSVKESGLRRVLVAGEPGGGEETFRRALEERYGAPVFEVMGIGDIAASLWGECHEQAGMHFSGGGVVHVELIDPDDGRPVPLEDGATGELVYTHLRREAVPLLRFRSRDHVVAWSSRCACGLGSLRVRCVGRTDDMLIVRGVNVFPSAIREVVARFRPRVTGAIAVRPKRRGVKQNPPLPVLVELAELDDVVSHAREARALGGGTRADARRGVKTPRDQSLAESITADLRSALAFSAEVLLVPAQTLPRSEYKSKLVDYSEAT